MKWKVSMGVMGLAVLAGCSKESGPTPPDCSGRYLVAYARQTGADTSDIYLYDFEQLGYHLLPNLNSSTQAERNPSITRDVRFIAFERKLSPANVDIEVYDRCNATSKPQPGLDTDAFEGDPAFTGDGTKLAFVRDTLGRREVRLYDGATLRFVPLPGIQGSGSYLDADPSPNQDGSRIAFTSNRLGTNDVFVWDAAGDSLLDLPDLASPANDSDPSMTPDGRYVVFASDRVVGGDFDLYLYDITAKAFIALPASVNTTYTERHPSINYDTSEIVFESNRPGTQGASDLYLCQRASGQVARIGASSQADDIEPCIVWQ